MNKLTTEAYEYRGELLNHPEIGKWLELCLQKDQSKANALVQVATDKYQKWNPEGAILLVKGIEHILLN